MMVIFEFISRHIKIYILETCQRHSRKFLNAIVVPPQEILITAFCCYLQYRREGGLARVVTRGPGPLGPRKNKACTFALFQFP